MQMEQENPMLMFVNTYELSAPVKALLEGGHKNAREMHLKLQDLIIPERMAELRGPQDMHAGCFSDVQLAFEYVIALLRLQSVNEFEQISLECLAQAMYMQDHIKSVRRRGLAAIAIAGALLATPWALHKYAQWKRA